MSVDLKKGPWSNSGIVESWKTKRLKLFWGRFKLKRWVLGPSKTKPNNQILDKQVNSLNLIVK